MEKNDHPFYTFCLLLSISISLSICVILAAPAVPGLHSGTLVHAQDNWFDTDRMISLMKLKEGDWAADVGSSDGTYTVPIAEIVEGKGRVFAVEIVADRLERLHQTIGNCKLTNVTPVFSVADNPFLPFNSLDAVLIRNTYHEFTNYRSMLHHILQSLKTGGRLVLADQITEEMTGESREAQTDDHLISIHYAKQELTEAGFEIKEEIDPFTKPHPGNNIYYWIIVAVKPHQ